eukprot:Opistho-2@61388
MSRSHTSELSALGSLVGFDEAVRSLHSQLSSDLTLEEDAVAFLHEGLSQLTAVVADKARQRMNGMRPVRVEDVSYCIKEIFEQDLASTMSMTGAKAVEEFYKRPPESKWNGSLTIPPKDIHQALGSFFEETATVFLTAGVEYACMEVLTAAGSYVRHMTQRKALSTKDILLRTDDKGLKKILKRAKKNMKASRSKGDPYAVAVQSEIQKGGGVMSMSSTLVNPSAKNIRNVGGGESSSLLVPPSESGHQRSPSADKRQRASIFGLTKQMFRSKSNEDVISEFPEESQSSRPVERQRSVEVDAASHRGSGDSE